MILLDVTTDNVLIQTVNRIGLYRDVWTKNGIRRLTNRIYRNKRPRLAGV